MSEQIELKPCPFCGSTEFEFWPCGDEGNVYNFGCKTADCIMYDAALDLWLPKDEIARQWNARASQWIPCSERLPSKYGSHLVTCDSLVEYCGYDQTLNRWYDPRTGYEKVGVTAWQEKPEPYQENA